MATLDLGRANGLIRTVFLPKIIDTITQSNPLFLMMRDKGELFEGGETITTPIMYGEYAEGEGGSFGDTDDVLQSEAGEDAAGVAFDWASYSQPIRITIRDLAKFASSEAAAVRLLRIRAQSAGMKMADRFGDHLYAPVGHDITDILSTVDIFDDTITYGGIDRAAAGNDFWKAKHVDASTDAVTATAITLRDVHDTIEEATEGNIRPDIGLTDKAAYNRIWELQMANMRYGDTDVVEYGGFTGIKVDGVPIFPDSHADNGGTDAGSNIRHTVRFYNLDYLHWVGHDDFNFVTTDLDFMSKTSPVLLSQIFWFGQFYCDNPRYQSELLRVLSTA